MENILFKILIADDQPLIAMELERILKEMVQCVVSICPGHALEQSLKDDIFDVVFVDAAPAEPDYSNQYQQISSTGAGVVFLSSYPKMVEALSMLSPSGILEKPFDEWEIKETLATLLSRK